MSDEVNDLDLAEDMAWLHADDPFPSPDSNDSIAVPTPSTSGNAAGSGGSGDADVAAATLLLNAGAATLSYTGASSSCGDSTAVDESTSSTRTRASASASALRPSKRAAAAGVAAPQQVSVWNTGGRGNVQMGEGHVVRMMPVWMMPAPQHPQGRMVMMPGHFLAPAAAARQQQQAAAAAGAAAAAQPNVRTPCFPTPIVELS